ncbi:hypothetical protein GobsT_74470 [Gemmata obscuriglobus]|uniref:Uncharacterized protein n=1 Tax=Gemmata obscuriglobus TaxID=114 RepID=A0A2Z3H9D0_9BACT|nr:hypothetical protein [Gemmata obscuriglobus]AWM41501.1 hypothetical protein C1280_33875 [Gemmata obscuriglobus]QEG32591.1 hypothetical protein GobsT_74470 [Gemmata obscuriglobus]VTS11947.1 unnamed protein product [Gemmata obscuriglobus UQM 2246]
MTRHAREAVSLALAAALGELALVALMTDWAQPGASALVLGFLLGPPLFLALAAWRRRAHADRSRVLFWVAVVVAVGGLGVLGFDLYRYDSDPQFRRTPGMNRVLVPVVQWGVLLVIWAGMTFQEMRERRAASRR